MLAPPCLLVELMPRGSLRSVLRDDAFEFKWHDHHSFAIDIASALAYLHGEKSATNAKCAARLTRNGERSFPPTDRAPRREAGQRKTPQRLMLCGVHCLNNLFCNESPSPGEAPPYSKRSLDAIAEAQHCSSRDAGVGGFFNPHRSVLGLGNYDVVVLELAVTEQGCRWEVHAKMQARVPRARM